MTESTNNGQPLLCTRLYVCIVMKYSGAAEVNNYALPVYVQGNRDDCMAAQGIPHSVKAFCLSRITQYSETYHKDQGCVSLRSSGGS